MSVAYQVYQDPTIIEWLESAEGTEWKMQNYSFGMSSFGSVKDDSCYSEIAYGECTCAVMNFCYRYRGGPMNHAYYRAYGGWPPKEEVSRSCP